VVRPLRLALSLLKTCIFLCSLYTIFCLRKSMQFFSLFFPLSFCSYGKNARKNRENVFSFFFFFTFSLVLMMKETSVLQLVLSLSLVVFPSKGNWSIDCLQQLDGIWFISRANSPASFSHHTLTHRMMMTMLNLSCHDWLGSLFISFHLRAGNPSGASGARMISQQQQTTTARRLVLHKRCVVLILILTHTNYWRSLILMQ